MDKYRLKIMDIVSEADGIRSYYFEKPEDLDWSEGAHVHIAHIGYDEGELPNKELIRHMSITTLPSEAKLGITTKVPGSNSVFKIKLSELAIEDEIVFFKFGSRMYLRRVNRPLIFLSMGVGMSTIRPMLLAFIQDSTDIPYLINVNVNSSGEFLFHNEFDSFSQDALNLHWLKSRHDFSKLLSTLPYQEEPIFYIVGSDEFMKENVKFLNGKGVRNEDMILDRKVEKLGEYFEY